MQKEAQFTISGLRGVWGQTLTEEVARRYIEGFAVFLQKRGAQKILLGRDARASGPIINAIAIDILTRAGFEVIDAGIIPTPTIIFLIRTHAYDGGIILTASHNPPEYNGIKFLTKSALYINQKEINELKRYSGIPFEERRGGSAKEIYSLGQEHVDQVLKNIEVQKIQDKKYTVVIDVINGAGYALAPLLLEKLGCSVTVINKDPDGTFGHIPEPLPENLKDLGKTVREMNADIGFALDPDADRLVVCDEMGDVVFEEYTLSLAIKNVLTKTPGDIVINLSTSNTNQDLATEAGGTTYRTKVGEGNVVAGIIEHTAIIGGEGGGGVIYPKINLCRDSLTGIGLILELLTRENKPLSQIVAGLPKYEFVKTKIPFEGNIEDVILKVIELFPTGTIDRQDGLRIDFPDRSWVQLRASNTEPIIRVFAEAKEKNTAYRLIEQVRSVL